MNTRVILSDLFSTTQNEKGTLRTSSLFSTPPIRSTAYRWPNPEASVGFPCAALGRNKCWEVTGPAREITSRLYSEIKDLLDQHSEYLHESEAVQFPIAFALYMIGRSETRASPTLLLSCGPKKPRQKAMNLVREAGTLQKYPGVLLAESSRSPISSAMQPCGTTGPADCEFVLFAPPTDTKVCGLPLHSTKADTSQLIQPNFITQKATIGGFVFIRNSEHEGLYCGLTVAHAFQDGLEMSAPSGDDEFSFDGEGCDESSSDDELEIKQDLSQTYLGSRKPSATNEDCAYASLSQSPQFGIGSLVASSLDGERPGFDWALIDIERPHTQQANLTSLSSKPGEFNIFVEDIETSPFIDTNVVVVTRRGAQTAQLSGSPSCYKSALGSTFEEVWTVRLDEGIAQGDSGSWVINPDTGTLYGHIVAGCPLTGVGYLISAKKIFGDIQMQLGGTVEVASRSSNQITKEIRVASVSGTEVTQQLIPMGTHQSKAELLRCLELSEDIFMQMEREAYSVYEQINNNNAPYRPYVHRLSSFLLWNEVSDKAKYEALISLSANGSDETQPYWDRGTQAKGCPNWIARWFLWRQFNWRYPTASERTSDPSVGDLDLMFLPAPSSTATSLAGNGLHSYLSQEMNMRGTHTLLGHSHGDSSRSNKVKRIGGSRRTWSSHDVSCGVPAKLPSSMEVVEELDTWP